MLWNSPLSKNHRHLHISCCISFCSFINWNTLVGVKAKMSCMQSVSLRKHSKQIYKCIALCIVTAPDKYKIQIVLKYVRASSPCHSQVLAHNPTIPMSVYLWLAIEKRMCEYADAWLAQYLEALLNAISTVNRALFWAAVLMQPVFAFIFHCSA